MKDFDKALTNWLHWMETQRNRSPATIREYQRDLRAFYRHLIQGEGTPSPDYLPALQTEHGQVERLADVITFAARLLARGANLRQVQELLGHVSPATTARLLQCRSTYTHVNNEQRRDAVNRLAPATTDLLE